MTWAVLFASVALLMFEVLQTVTLSLQVFPSNAFLVISIALFGLGAGGSLATLLIEKRWADAPGWMWGVCAAYGMSLLLAGVLNSRLSNLSSLILVSFVPYLFAGLFLAVVFHRWPERAGRIYCFNLVGSALGCVAVVWALDGLGDAPLILLLIAGLGLVAALCLALPRSRGATAATLALVAAVAALAPVRDRLFVFTPSADKTYGQILRNPEMETTLDWSKWGYFGRLDSVIPRRGVENFGYFGDWVTDAERRGADSRLLFASGDNWSTMVDFGDNDAYRERFMRRMVPSAPYILFDAPDVLNIGVGGGVDIFLALSHGARSVTGVEINPLMIEAVRDRHPSFFDGSIRQPSVTLVQLDGRTYVDQSDRVFDIITLTAVDTGAGLAAGAYVLSENYLYTEEAFDAFLQALRPEGVLFVYRPKRDLVRVLTTATAALRRLGAEDPERHLAIFGGNRWVGAVIGRSPLPKASTQRLADRLVRGDFGGRTFWLLGRASDDPTFNDFLGSVVDDREDEFLRTTRYDFGPVQDDRPFVYHFDRDFSSSPAGRLLLRILFVVGVAASLLIFAPLLGVSGVRAAPTWGSTLAFFLAIGLAFMLVEVALIQKLVLFLGHPSYSLVVTLFTILVFSGLGSLWVDRVGGPPERLVGRSLPILIAIGVFYAFGLRPVLDSLQLPSLAARAALTVGLLAPGSFLMGIPFPSMLRSLTGERRPLICWAWGINSLASVVASIAAVMISMNWGFTATLLTGSFCYLLALGCALFRRQPAAV